MALGRRPHDREPQARAGLAAGAAPEAGEGLLGLVWCEPGAFVGDGQPGNPVLLRSSDRDPPALWPVELGVPDEILERALERGPIPLHGDRLECTGLDPPARSGAGELVEPNHLRRLRGGFLP